MALPLFDPIELPPDYVLVDIHGIEDADLRQQLQAQALEAWLEETGEDPGEFIVREWADDEGMFAVCDKATEEIVGVSIVTGIEDA